MVRPTFADHRALIADQLQARNAASARFFPREAPRLARVCALMADRFARGGRLLAFGSGPLASDAQHVAVEFVHPVLVGKRALPALDLSSSYAVSIPALVRAEDVVMGFAPATGDPQVEAALAQAASRGALCLALPGAHGDYAAEAPSADPFIHQELIEILYHTLWETVHVFFDRRPVGHGGGAASFLYPFLGDDEQADDEIVPEVAASILSKAAAVERLRDQFAGGGAEGLSAAAGALHHRVAQGGTVYCFGNGGSATDASDLALDLVASPKGYRSIPAVSLAADAATLTAIGNDIGPDAVFTRQVIAHGRPQDVAFAISTSGGSANIIAALQEARARGLLTIALLGYDGGDVRRRGLADHCIVVESDQIPRVQELHACIYHVMLDLLDAIDREP